MNVGADVYVGAEAAPTQVALAETRPLALFLYVSAEAAPTQVALAETRPWCGL